MIKIAMIGAGSVVFSRNLTGDILGCPEFKDATISYMDVDAERLEVAGDLCRKVAKAVGANPTIETTMDRRKRTLLQVRIAEADIKATEKSVERLMGNKAEARFDFIQERAPFADEAALDV